MANRFWVGGTATWNATAATKWATTSGGAGGAAIPTAADDVFFDVLSTGTCTLSASSVCRSIVCTGFTGTISHPAATIFTIGDGTAGAFTLAAGMTYTLGNANTSALAFISTTTGNNITFAGKTCGNVEFNGAGGVWTLQDTVTTGTGATITHTAGTLDTNGKTLNIGKFNSNNSNTRTLTLGASAITCSGNNTPWTINTSTNLTFNANTSSITLTNTGGTTFAGGALTYNNVTISGGGASSITKANTFANLTISGAAAKTDSIDFSANQTISTALTLSGNSAINRLLVMSSVIGTARTLTSSTLNVISNCDFQDITGAGITWNLAAVTGNSGDCGGNSGITFTTPANQFWVSGTGNFSASKWFTTSGGIVAGRVPLPQDTAMFDANSFTAGSQTVTMDMPRTGSMNWTGATNSPTFAMSSVAFTTFGSFTAISAMSLTGTQLMTFAGRSTFTLTSAGKTWPNGMQQTAPGGTVTLQDGMTRSSFLGVSAGTFAANNFNLSITSFTASRDSATVSVTINMGSGTWTNTSTSPWNVDSSTTINASTSTIIISDTSASTKTFSGGGKTYANLTINGAVGNGTAIITGTNTFATLTGQPDAIITLQAPLTTTVSGLSTTGTSGHLVTLQSSGAGSAATLACANPVDCDYMSIKDSTASGNTPFYAGANSTNVSGNTNWTFTARPAGGVNSGFFFFM